MRIIVHYYMLNYVLCYTYIDHAYGHKIATIVQYYVKI